MKVLITGITGLLGHQVGRSCHETGHTVVGLYRRSEMNLNLDYPIEWRYQDLRDEFFEEDLLDEIDAVIHCAADTRMGSGINQNQDALNVFAVAKLVDLGVTQKLSRFILISSSNTFEIGTKEKPGNEKSPLERSEKLFNYANSKIAAEMICRHAAKERGLHTVILNPTFMIGPSDSPSISSNKLIHYILRNKTIPKLNGSKNFVDLRDVSDACVAALSKGRRGENYILSNQLVTFEDLVNRVKSLQGTTATMIPIPDGLVKISGRVSSFFESAFRKPFNFNYKTAQLLLSTPYFSNAKAKKHLGFNPRPIDDTLKELVEEYKGRQ